MEATQLLAMQAGSSLLVYVVLASWYVRPWLAGKPRATALTILVFPHTFRFIGVTLLVPGVVEPGLPAEFARPTAIGDTVTTLLAWLALVALRYGWRLSIPLVWLFNVVGLADLLMNVIRGMRMQVAAQLGAAYPVPAFVVPGMFVLHILVFVFLLRGNAREQG